MVGVSAGCNSANFPRLYPLTPALRADPLPLGEDGAPDHFFYQPTFCLIQSRRPQRKLAITSRLHLRAPVMESVETGAVRHRDDSGVGQALQQ
jgi:hypothetical protein